MLLGAISVKAARKFVGEIDPLWPKFEVLIWTSLAALIWYF